MIPSIDTDKPFETIQHLFIKIKILTSQQFRIEVSFFRMMKRNYKNLTIDIIFKDISDSIKKLTKNNDKVYCYNIGREVNF